MEEILENSFITYDAKGYGVYDSPVIIQRISENYFRLDSVDNLEFFIEFELPDNWEHEKNKIQFYSSIGYAKMPNKKTQTKFYITVTKFYENNQITNLFQITDGKGKSTLNGDSSLHISFVL